jgi:hypothetical protein
LNDLEHDRRYLPENPVIELLSKILISPDVFYFYAKRLRDDVKGDFHESCIEAAYRRFERHWSWGFENRSARVTVWPRSFVHSQEPAPAPA